MSYYDKNGPIVTDFLPSVKFSDLGNICLFLLAFYDFFLLQALITIISALNGLIILRIRFRASDFGLAAIINLIRAKSKQASCAGHSFFCSCESAVRFLDSEN